MSGSRWARWGFRGFLAIADQALFALSNFGINLMLARWLPESQYGAFAVAYSVFLLVGTAHTGLVTQPMLVFGPGKYARRLPDYLAVVLGGQWVFGIAVSGLALVVGLGVNLIGMNVMSTGMYGLAAAAPFMLYQWSLRKSCYARFAPAISASGGVIYAMAIGSGACLVVLGGMLSPFTVFLILGTGSAVSGAWIQWRLGLPVRGITSSTEMFPGILTDHWRYGRWAVATGALLWFSSNIYYLVLPLIGGLEHSGALRALMNLTMPVSHTFSALVAVLLPALVVQRTSPGFMPLQLKSFLAFLCLAMVYWLVLGLWHEPILAFVYGGRYVESGWLLWILGLIPVAGAATNVFSSVLQAMERPNRVFWAYAVGGLFTLFGGLGMTFYFGLLGVAVGLTMSTAVIGVSLIVFAITQPTSNSTTALDRRGETLY